MHGTTVSFVKFCLHCHADLLYAVAVAHNQGFEDQKTYNKVIKALPKKHRPSKKERRTAILVPYIENNNAFGEGTLCLNKTASAHMRLHLGHKVSTTVRANPPPPLFNIPRTSFGEKNKKKKQIGRFCRQL